MERLEEYKADRKSRSLEEKKGEHLLPRGNLNINVMVDS